MHISILNIKINNTSACTHVASKGDKFLLLCPGEDYPAPSRTAKSSILARTEIAFLAVCSGLNACGHIPNAAPTRMAYFFSDGIS